MPSRLSSLLVRDGLVGVKRMEKAFQRQVIYGGSLDTILLEMKLVPEERLTQYLALASGLPPAARDEGDVIQRRRRSTRSRASSRSSTAPCRSRSTARRCACSCARRSRSTELEDLADLLDRPLQPLITPEYRWHLVFASAYGARSAGAVHDARARRSTSTRRRRRSAVAQRDRRRRVASRCGDDARSPIAQRRRPSARRSRRSAPSGVDARRRRDAAHARSERTRSTSGRRAPQPSDRASRACIAPATRSIGRQRRRHTRPDDAAARSAGPREAACAAASHRADLDGRARLVRSPIVRARELLATAEDRDTVFLTLLRAARSRARWAGLLTVQGGAAIGRVALAEPGIDIAAISKVLIPLDVVSPFRDGRQQPAAAHRPARVGRSGHRRDGAPARRHDAAVGAGDADRAARPRRRARRRAPRAQRPEAARRHRAVAARDRRVRRDRPADRQAQGRRLSRARRDVRWSRSKPTTIDTKRIISQPDPHVGRARDPNRRMFRKSRARARASS